MFEKNENFVIKCKSVKQCIKCANKLVGLGFEFQNVGRSLEEWTECHKCTYVFHNEKGLCTANHNCDNPNPYTYKEFKAYLKSKKSFVSDALDHDLVYIGAPYGEVRISRESMLDSEIVAYYENMCITAPIASLIVVSPVFYDKLVDEMFEGLNDEILNFYYKGVRLINSPNLTDDEVLIK